LVFTHPEVELLIDNSCKVDWGKVEDWAGRILKAKPIRQFTVEIQLEVADAILTFANIVDSASPQRDSAALLAQRLYNTAVSEAKKYVSKWERPVSKAKTSHRKRLTTSRPAVSVRRTRVMDKKPASDRF
jgi:uncharacterized protein YdiU (UPF0061 family)